MPRATENLAPSLEREKDTTRNNKEVVTEVELHKDPTLGIDKDHVDIAKDNEKGKEDAYADLAMNEEMMENDDLLDEISEEVQAFEKELEDERIEAISQLSPSRKDRLSLTKLKEPSEVQGGEVVARGTSNKPALGKIDTTIAQTIGKRRGSRSPDLKGAAASKKLATPLAPEIDEIKALSSDFLSFSISAIPRSQNACADILAKGGRLRKLNPSVSVFAPIWLAPEASLTAAE
ncbi:hypothetical protein HID58_023314 [Brassica napus]|uniref:Uncharacterized protein n=1 Tax=Brassica napus TaxID=3708 RepID=A0ABQ8D1Q6_BRANA|nr:hypothetical protein HID58_023314 [Brassica napus]